MFHSHVSFICYPSIQCAPSGSEEWSTNTLLVAWPEHNLLIAWPASPHRRFYSVFSHTFCIFASFSMFEFAHVWACICLHMFIPRFHSFTVFPSECAPTWLSRAIHQHTFSRLAGAQFTDCMTCPTSQRFFILFFHTLLHFCQFFNVLVCTCLSSHAYSYVFINLQSFRLSVPPHGSAEQSTSTVLVAWLAHNFLIALPASPHKGQQSYQLYSAIDPMLHSTLSPSKTPGTSFRLTSNRTLQFRVTLW